jgi:hypothetical protein
MDVIILVVARMSRIRQQIYDEQYCLNELALITVGMEEADLVFEQQPVAVPRKATPAVYRVAA